MQKYIQLDHGSGGEMSQELIQSLFLKHFGSQHAVPTDAVILDLPSRKIALTTDSYVVSPIFFPGGNIGKLAVCGTVNDLAVTGARPLYLTCGFIVEEGLPFDDLEEIVISMAKEAKHAGVQIVTGDTKVVEKGSCDKLFINTAGVGIANESSQSLAIGANIKAGDQIIINGSLADHGMAIMSKRQGFEMQTPLLSDCASLNGLIASVMEITRTGANPSVNFMRDATRGGVATVLCEVTKDQEFGIEIYEDSLVIKEEVKGLCELLGFDPLYVANEGKVVFIVESSKAQEILCTMQKDPQGKQACIIGQVTVTNLGKVVLKTKIGGSRVVSMLSGAQLPRIC